MTRQVAHCEQFVHTWARRTVEHSSGGFGTVLRSRNWDEVADLAGTAADLQSMSLADRQGDALVLVVRRTQGATVVTVKQPLGNDGAGRPGNYVAHTLVDPTGQVGLIDVAGLLIRHELPRRWSMDADPQPAAAPMPVDLTTESWQQVRAALDSSQIGAHPLWLTAIRDACHAVPASVVNTLAFPLPAEGLGISDTDRQVFADAAALGMARSDDWWVRDGRSVAAWVRQARAWTVSVADPRRLDDDELVERLVAGKGGDAIAARQFAERLTAGGRLALPAGYPVTARSITGLVRVACESGGPRGSTSSAEAPAVQWGWRQVERAADDEQADFVTWVAEAGLLSRLPTEAVRAVFRWPSNHFDRPVQTWALNRAAAADLSAWHRSWSPHLHQLWFVTGSPSFEALTATDDLSWLYRSLVDLLQGGADPVQVFSRHDGLVAAAVLDAAFIDTGEEPLRAWLQEITARLGPKQARQRFVRRWPAIVDAHGWPAELAEAFTAQRRSDAIRQLVVGVLLGAVVTALVIAVVSWLTPDAKTPTPQQPTTSQTTTPTATTTTTVTTNTASVPPEVQ